MRVLDLFSAAAGGWSLGLHRAGFRTVAACEWIAWRRALYAENNPGVPIYDDVRTLTGDQLLADLGAFPDVIVGSPPCQDISSANTKGKGVDGERSSLYFDAVRLVRECNPRWFAFENSANLRSRGADRVLGELEGLGYACWAFVVSAEDLGANHERKRSWIIGCDLGQLADASQVGCSPRPRDRQGRGDIVDGCVADHGAGDGAQTADADETGWDAGRRGRRCGVDVRVSAHSWNPDEGQQGEVVQFCRGQIANPAGGPADANEAGQENGCVVASLRTAQQPDDGCRSGCCDDREGDRRQVGLRAGDRVAAFGHGADWSLADLARHIRLDDGLPARVAHTRVAVGGPRGTSAASLIVEAFGDAVIPQIPEAIGRAILRVEAAMAAVHGRAAA